MPTFSRGLVLYLENASNTSVHMHSCLLSDVPRQGTCPHSQEVWFSTSERCLTSGSLHRTRRDKEPHMLPVITVKLPFITLFHPHRLRIPRSFPKDPKIAGTTKQDQFSKLKYPLKQGKILDQIFHYPPPDSQTSRHEYHEKEEKEKEEEMCMTPGAQCQVLSKGALYLCDVTQT